jgi:multiple sugar transport system permease protein
VTQAAAGHTAGPGGLREGGERRLRNPDRAWPWLFVLPTVLGLAVFYFWPVIQTAYYSLTSWGVFGGAEFVGLDNWRALLGSGDVPRALVNTLVYTAILLLGLPISIYLASLLNRPGLRFAAFYRVLYFAPFVSMPAAIALVWGMIFNSQYGILNQFLGLFGAPRIYWTSTEWVALIAIGIVGVWSSLGFNIIVLGAGLKAIPGEMYEAARIDGASNSASSTGWSCSI